MRRVQFNYTTTAELKRNFDNICRSGSERKYQHLDAMLKLYIAMPRRLRQAALSCGSQIEDLVKLFKDDY